MRFPYPLTIIVDRYNGTYSGAKFLAFNLDPDDIPSEAWNASDNTTRRFWENYDGPPVGMGLDPLEALQDLQGKIGQDPSGPWPEQEAWWEVRDKMGKEAARKHLATKLRAFADQVDRGGYPDIFGAAVEEEPGVCQRGRFIERLSVTLSNPWPG